MSWYIEKVGKRESVAKQIESDQNLPDALKKFIASITDDGNPDAPKGISIKGQGHQWTGPGSCYSNVCSLEIRPIDLVE